MATSVKKSRAAAGAKKKEAVQPGFSPSSEVVAICVTALGVLLMIIVFSEGQTTGALGAGIKNLLVSLFGIGAFVLPFAVAACCLIVIFADGASFLRGNIAMMTGMFLVVISHVGISGDDGTVYETFSDFIASLYNSGAAGNGGLIGGLLGRGLSTAIGVTGAYVALWALGISLLVLMSRRSFLGYLRKLGKKAAKKTAEIREAMDERRKLALEYDDEYEDEDDYAEEAYKPAKSDLANKKRKVPPTIPTEEDEDTGELLMPERGDKPAKPSFVGRKRGKFVVPLLSELDAEPDGDSEDIGGIARTFPAVSDEAAPEYKDGAPWDDLGDITIEGVDVETGGKPEPKALSLEETLDKSMSHSSEGYQYPNLDLLLENDYKPSVSTMVQIKENSRKLEETLKSFGVEARVVAVSKGPTVTRYELSPGPGVKVNKISNLADDLALSLAATGIRIEAPIPGKSAVGIELPNRENQPVFLREVLDSPEFTSAPGKLTFAVGKDIAGKTVVSDIAKMPHLLIAGSTGSGKSVCINTLITSILFKSRPDEVKLLMVDPKVVELSIYNGIPHLLIPVVTDPKKAAGALNWAVQEMEKRYGLLAGVNVRDLKGYNQIMLERGEETLPQIVIIIDELADLMMASGKDVEDSICRIAQKARAAGLHLILATQRPSVDIITGKIKANVGSRLAFAVSSGIDSRTILDQVGAERLLGKGDMLFSPMGLSKPQRIQGAFISDGEVEGLVNFLKGGVEHIYDKSMIEEITYVPGEDDGKRNENLTDEFIDAVELIFEKEKASTSMLQRYFRIGYNSAARLMEDLEKHGVVGPEDGAKPRKILMTRQEWDNYKKGIA